VLRLALSLLILMTTSAAIAQEQQQVAVLNLARFTGTKAARNILEKERFESAFARALESAGWSVLQATDETCSEGVECLGAVAKRTGVSRVIRITGQGNVQDGYQLNVEAFRPKTARTEKSIYCETCNPARIAELAAESAQQQLAAVARETEPTKIGPSSPVLAPAIPEEPDRSTVTPPPSEEHASYRWVSWTLLAVAVPVTAYGAWAIYKDGERSNPAAAPISGEPQRERSSSKTLGIACVAAGLGAALLAGVFYIFEPSKSTSVALSPSSVNVAVRF
jgi:hypothetical protein